MQIRELIKRDLNAKIAEVIQVDQIDEQQVHDEITDYVVTERIKEHYLLLLKAFAEGKSQPDENVGIWISGFFGSGKSSFAKNLGYVLLNKPVLGQPASDLFIQQVDDAAVANLVRLVNRTIPTEVVMFDISKERSPSSTVAQVMYRALLRALGYAEDFDIAELEISLEGEGKLADFEARFNQRYAPGNDKAGWRKQGRSGTQIWNRTGSILSEMDPRTYPTPESFAQALVSKRVEVTPQFLVQRAFDLMERRRPSKALVFIVDEVGAFVAYNEERLEDLRAVTEEFGKQSRMRVKANRAVAPTWVIITSQERLDEVVSALGTQKRILMAKVQDRFHYKVDLSPADIREVTTRRVLSKNDEGKAQLEKLFATHEGSLSSATRLERTSRNPDINVGEFTQFYPYLPHYIDLSIDIMSSIRLQVPGAVRHIGGSSRTIISQVHQMLVSPRTDYASKPIGALVTLDQVYDLIEGQVGSNRQRDVSRIDSRSAEAEPVVRAWAGKVARVIALLEFVRNLPRTPHNIAALLVGEAGKPAPESEVKAALAWLVQYEYARETEEGYKLQTEQEKSWSTERKAYSPKPKERNEIERELLKDIFEIPALASYNFRNLRKLGVGITVDGAQVGNMKDIPLVLMTSEEPEGLRARVEEVRAASRQPDHQSDIFWVFPLSQEIHDLIANLYASRQMVAKYQAVQSQNRISPDEQTSLTSERQEEARIRNRLREKLLSDALGRGVGMFRGTSKDASDLGDTFTDALHKLFSDYVPDLYPKLEMGAKSLKGNEPIEILTAATLSALSQVFYNGSNGFGLVTKQNDRYVPDTSAPIAKEVLDYLKQQQDYGSRVTGKTLSEHFGGLGYGWDTDVLRVVTATLLRAGRIEVTHQGRRFRNHLDPQCRAAFEKIPQFNASSFAPRESIDLKALIAAVRSYETLTGDEVDVEEGTITTAFKQLAAADLNELIPLLSEARVNRLPVVDLLNEYRITLDEVQSAASDDCVRILAGQGSSLKDTRDRFHHMREVFTEKHLESYRDARATRNELWPTLQSRSAGADLGPQADELGELLDSPTVYESIPHLVQLAGMIRSAYQGEYTRVHQERSEAFAHAIADARRRDEWAQAFPLLPSIEEVDDSELQQKRQQQIDELLKPLKSRQCIDEKEEPILPDGETRCVHCHATLDQMESDLAAVASIKLQVINRLQELAAPSQKIAYVRASDFVATQLIRPPAEGDPTDIEAAQKALNDKVTGMLMALSDEIYKRLAEADIVIVE